MKLPKSYNYRPLPQGLTIENSKIEGKGLFTTYNCFILEDANIGTTHVKIDNELIRTPLGGFINHSTKPNCKITDLCQIDKPYYYLVALRDIFPDEELTVNYFKSACGKDVFCNKK